jgi:hypothetical protein
MVKKDYSMQTFLDQINSEIKRLDGHELYQELRDLSDLRLFMQRHVYAVYDFMSLTKAIQNYFAPIESIWRPPRHPEMARFINEIVLGEESDFLFEDESRPMSHFEMYLGAMQEIGLKTDAILSWASSLEFKNGRLDALDMPGYCLDFVEETFSVVHSQKIQLIAAYFCFGREKIIPNLFQSILQESKLDMQQAPVFHFYLKRHIEIDGDHHGPLAYRMIQYICGDDTDLWEQVVQATAKAISARIRLWDGVLAELKYAKQKRKHPIMGAASF